MTLRVRNVIGAALFLVLPGCYESTEPFGPPDGTSLDRSLLGTWQCREPEGKSDQVATLFLLPYDDRQYYIEWREDQDVSRYGGHSSKMNGEMLVNVRELKDKPRKTSWVFFRAKRDAEGGLDLAIVNKDALKATDDRAARDEVARRVKDDSLYAPWAKCTPVP